MSAPSTSAHADVVFTWKGYATKTIELIGSFNGWKKEELSPYLQIPSKEQYTTVQEDEAIHLGPEDGGSARSGHSGASLTSKGSIHSGAAGAQANASITFGRSSIIKQLGPGKYMYRFVIDGVEKLDEHASVVDDPITGIPSNIILVINPLQHHKSKLPTALTRALGEKAGNDGNMSSRSLASLGSLGMGSPMSPMNSPMKASLVPAKKIKPGRYDNLIHVNELHSDEAREKKNRELQGLSKINLRNMSLFDDGAWAFASFLHHNSLISELDLSYNSISDDGMQAVATILPRLAVLRVFKANGNSFGFDGTRYICGPLSNSKTIERIELSGNSLCDDGAELLAKILLPRNGNLKELYLDENKIGDDGAEHLGEGLLQVSLSSSSSSSLRFKGVILYTGGILCNVEWCIRQP